MKIKERAKNDAFEVGNHITFRIRELKKQRKELEDSEKQNSMRLECIRAQMFANEKHESFLHSLATGFPKPKEK